MKKFFIAVVCSSFLFGSIIIPVTSVMATEEISIQQISEEVHLTVAQEEKAEEIEKEIQRLNSLSEKQRTEEIAKTLAEAEGQEFYFGEQTGVMSRAAASTNAKIVNGGVNFFAYNKEGVNKLANTLGIIATATGGASAIAGLIAKHAPGISTKIAASIITGIGGLVTKDFMMLVVLLEIKQLKQEFELLLQKL